METKVPKIFTDGMDVQLIAVKYKFISDVGEPNSKILPVDTFSLKKLYADRFVVSIKRMVSFEPKQLFYIDVESSATFYLDIKKMSGNFDSKEKKWDLSKIEKNTEKHSWWKQTLIIGWEVWLDYKICSCCKRKLWKDIVAHINNKWVITIHKRNCKVLNEVNKDRLLTAYIDWEEEESIIYKISFILENKMWVLKELTETVFSMRIDIDTIDTEKIGNSQRKIILWLKIFDYEYMIIDRLLERLKIKLWDSLINSFILWVDKV